MAQEEPRRRSRSGVRSFSANLVDVLEGFPFFELHHRKILLNVGVEG